MSAHAAERDSVSIEAATGDADAHRGMISLTRFGVEAALPLL
ncbi:MAG TPA: hypothetical protein VGA88_04610 [Burkholderiales bacterium]